MVQTRPILQLGPVWPSGGHRDESPVFQHRNTFRHIEFARAANAELAVDRRRTGPGHPYSLSPKSLLEIPKGSRLVLPSPNGSSLSFAASDMRRPVLAGCLRNAAAVARAAGASARTVAVIAAGERWDGGDALRPATEDLIGAGAIIRELPGKKSPEALAAAAAFEAARGRTADFLMQTSSGKELDSSGYRQDVVLASELDVSERVPMLKDRAFVAVTA